MPKPHPEETILDSLRRQYLQLLTPTDISLTHLPPSLLLDQSFQHTLYTHLFNPNRKSHQCPPPPPLRYTARVVKRLITKIEEEAWKEGYACPEIDEDLIDFYATLIATIPAEAASPTDSTSTTHVTYTIAAPTTTTTTTTTTTHPNGESLTLIESRNIISSSGHTGSRTWEAALALGELLISSHHNTTHPLTFPPTSASTNFTTHIPQKHILELGAGTGFLSILCAKLGAHKVLATDGDWRVCSSLQKNVAENKVSGVVSVGRLLWGSGNVVENAEDTDLEPDPRAEHSGGKGREEGYITPDVVLAADVTYDTSIIPSLVTELKYILTQKNPHAQVLVAATVRNPKTIEAFLKELERHSLLWASELWVPHEPRILYYDTTAPIQILKITCPMVGR
ncbi:hypothetical protein L211DRAFT_836050 [Terfezia boudieri ATCC MYA-4762]|uniref:FAM86 N-terminal domain-containing protein n=1 Tax=Terfezia boudieri ATCC MYA-4762 TaxID=1051890 RepID=A0A3N4LSU8_9PEZI|nr:hypothetical protein L211DRAFT_836050 [Terfezia boudieri ATCC MYA-4762]